MDVAESQHEINRLKCELDQAHTEEVQSAINALSILEEKQSLTKRYEELENSNENVKQELKITQEALIQTSHKVNDTKSVSEEKNNLKSKYDNNKMVFTESIIQLRDDLRTLKEFTTTISSWNAMFNALTEELVTRMGDLKRQLVAAEGEKKTLNQQLRLSVEHKKVVAHRLEEVEMDREMVVTETISKLRNEMRTLMEDADKLSSSMASFAAMWEEQVPRIDNLERLLVAAEGKKKERRSMGTPNSSTL
ncbi:protein bicaudal D-like [Acyrthosiphon pisum]|uniref:Uncharacterized protein n=1 Tax=Acyrthosiphon pisum TaxID=7029 RepID=A0A8R2D5Y1_ACYPI|nr:protein bicaudal D-like [Acyrthosiphon pisum]|eukprot:XP_016663106.1 PREDICTED: protein bicaudal D-like [Acyrthosiphon pisum]